MNKKLVKFQEDWSVGGGQRRRAAAMKPTCWVDEVLILNMKFADANEAAPMGQWGGLRFI